MGGLRGAGGQLAAVFPLHGFDSTPDPGQEGVAEELTQQGILGKVVQELGEVLQKRGERTFLTRTTNP